ncbi:MAG: MBG domain-containing protein, partial [Eubacterium sp.]
QYSWKPQTAGDYDDIKVEFSGDVNYIKNQAGLGTYSIDKGNLAAPQKELPVYYGSTQNFDLSMLTSEAELAYSDLKIEDSESIFEGTPIITDDQKLSFSIRNDSSLVDKTAILRLRGTAKAENTYNPVIGEIKVTVTNRILPVLSGEIKTTGTLTYGDALGNLGLMGSYKNLLDGSPVPGKLEWVEPSKVLEAGEGQRVAYRFTPDDQITYLSTQGELSVTVEKAEVLMTLSPKESIYDGSPKTGDTPVMVNKKYPDMAVMAEEGEVQYTYIADESFESPKAPKNAGTYKVKAAYSGNSNFLPVESEAVDLIINQKSIVVTPNANQKKIYGDKETAMEYSLSAALAQGDSLKGSLSRGSIEDVGEYEINLGSLTAGSNYNLSCTSGVLYEITPAVATIKVAEKLTAVYDGESHTIKPKVEGV